jgi:RNA polymerase sigma-70 factor (ECF subfamily)
MLAQGHTSIGNQEPKTSGSIRAEREVLLLAARPALVRIARRMGADAADAEDLVQETLLRALDAIERFEGGQFLMAWLRRILVNVTIDRARAARRERAQLRELESLGCEQTAEVPAWAVLSEADVRAATAGLSERVRATFVLFALEGWPYEEISRRLGIPGGTVATRLQRARRQLRAALQRRLAEAGPANVVPFAPRLPPGADDEAR